MIGILDPILLTFLKSPAFCCIQAGAVDDAENVIAGTGGGSAGDAAEVSLDMSEYCDGTT